MAQKNLDTGYSETTSIADTDLLSLFKKSSDSLWRKITGATLRRQAAVDENNLVVNGDMRVAQQGTSFTSTGSANNDDSYTLDQVIMLSDGNDIVDVTQESSGGVDGGSDYIQLDVETVSKKFGILMPIENKDCLNVIGDVVSLSFDAKVSDAAKLSDIRAAVLTWSSTADSITSDVVSSWNAEGSNPTFATNWTAENTPSDLSVGTSWERVTIENISVDTASAANLAVFIWSNDVATNDTLANTLSITNVKLQKGSVATAFQARPFQDELARSQRYFFRAINGADQTGEPQGVALVDTTTTALVVMRFPVEMLSAPSGNVSAASDFQVFHSGSSTEACTGLGISEVTTRGARLDATVASGLTAGEAAIIRSSSASSTLDLDARL